MRFRVTKSGGFYFKDEADRLKEIGFVFREDKNSGFSQHFRKVDSDVFIDIDSLEELVEFSGRWREIIVKRGEIEIYDDYRE